MINIMPIPRTILRDEVIHNSIYSRDINNKVVSGGKYRLKFVSVSGTKEFSNKDSGKYVKTYSYKMLYDVKNSTGMIKEFKLEDIIKYDNKEYTINKINKVRGRNNKIHHYILYLV
jgi:hypothetical protein